MMLKQLIIGITALACCQTVHAQQVQATLSHYSTDNGLASNAIAGIYQDDYGFIWMATWNGLSRFDGFNFYNYKTGNSSGIKNLHNRILDLAIDQSAGGGRGGGFGRTEGESRGENGGAERS